MNKKKGGGVVLYESPYLAHYGVQGQKWGVRHYQNEDGTLTEEGKARYGDSKTYKDTPFRKFMSGDVISLRKIATRMREDTGRLGGDYKKERDAQRAFNDDLKAYNQHTSTGKMLLQNLLFLPTGGSSNSYRASRAIGRSRLESIIDSGALVRPLAILLGSAAGTAVSLYGLKKGNRNALETGKNIAANVARIGTVAGSYYAFNKWRNRGKKEYGAHVVG